MSDRTVLARAVAGCVTLLASLALVFFFTAGSLHVWRAWLYLAAFAACVVFITADLALRDPALLERRVAAGPVAERESGRRVISAIASLFFLAMYFVAGLDARFGWSAVPRALSVAADDLVIAGFVIVWLTFRANSYTSAVIEVADAQRVVDRGPYAVVRHPMYSGAVLLVLATPVALGSWLAIPWAIALAFTIVVRLVGEESYLGLHLEDYDAYRTRVTHRLAPFLW